jgi:hypothetical protein
MRKTTKNPDAVTARATRRQVFGASAALLLVGATEAGAAKANELDGALLAAAKRIEALEAEERRLQPLYDVMPPTPESEHYEAECDALRDERKEVLDYLAETPARTPEGLRAKALALVAFWGGPDGRHELDLISAHQRLEWSLIKELAGRAEA